MLQLGDRVAVTLQAQAHPATVRFLGVVAGKQGSWAGVELDTPGLGKNDGSVQGHAYFTCPPLAGLFLPPAKLAPLTAAVPSTSVKRAPSAPSTPVRAAPSTPARPSTFRPTPRAVSGTVRRSSLTPLKSSLAASTKYATPPLPSIPLAFRSTTPLFRSVTPTSGGTPAKPKPSLSTPNRRSSNVFDRSTGPSGAAPPLPPPANSVRTPASRRTSNVFDRSVGPSSTVGPSMGERTPSSRRTSNVFDRSVGPSTERTPGKRTSSVFERSVGASTSSSFLATEPPRSFSRSSFASSTRSSTALSIHGETSLSFQDELRSAKEEKEGTFKLLEASERMGRELEERIDRLGKDGAEKERELRREIERLTTELEATGERETAALHGRTGSEEELLKERGTNTTLGASLLSLETTHATTLSSHAVALANSQAQLAAMTLELKGSQETLISERLDWADQRAALEEELERLQEAGLALCGAYEAKIAALTPSPLIPSPSPSPIIAPPPQEKEKTRAEQIDLESSLLELEHLRTKLAGLEGTLERITVDREVERSEWDGRKKRASEIEGGLRGDLKLLKSNIDGKTKEIASLKEKILSLEFALQESSAALEGERAEVEHLRGSGGGSPVVSRTGTEVGELQREVEELKGEIGRKEEELLELGIGLEEARKAVVDATAETTTLRAREATLTAEIVDLNAHLELLKGELQVAREGGAQTAALKSKVSSLTSEMSDLESLLEAKIFHSQSLEKTVRELQAQAVAPVPSATSIVVSSGTASPAPVVEEEECGMCGSVKHKLDDCPEFGGAKTVPHSNGTSSAPAAGKENFCDDCEEYGHVLEDCPLANEMF